MKWTKDTAPAGLYAKRSHVCDNDGLGDPVEDLFDVLLKTDGGKWYYLAESGTWVGLSDKYDPFTNDDLPLMRIGSGTLAGVTVVI